MVVGDAAGRVAETQWGGETAAFLGTMMTSPLEEIEDALFAADHTAGNQGVDEAGILGVHVEGLFISADKLGAQPDFIIGDIAVMEPLMRLARIGSVICAPEAGPGRCSSALALRARPPGPERPIPSVTTRPPLRASRAVATA